MDNVKNKIKINQIINVKEIDIIPNNIEKLKTIFYNTFEPKNKQDWKFYFLDKDNDKISMENNQIYFKEQIDVILKSDNPQIYAQYTKDNYNEIFNKELLKKDDELKNLKIKNDMLIKNSINENNKLKEKINDYEKKLKSYEEIVGSQMSSFEYLDNENKNNLSKINELNSQINKLQNQIKSKDYEIAKLKNGGNNVQNIYKNIDDNTEIQKYIQEIKKLEDNNKQINNNLNSINLELKKNKNEIKNLKKEKAQLQFNLDKKEILLKKNEEKNKLIKIEIINRLREKYNKLFENTFKELNNNVEEKLQIINNLFINEYINS